MKERLDIKDDLHYHLSQTPVYQDICSNQSNDRFFSQSRVLYSSNGTKSEFNLIRKGNSVFLENLVNQDVVEEDNFCISLDGDGILVRSCMSVDKYV